MKVHIITHIKTLANVKIRIFGLNMENHMYVPLSKLLRYLYSYSYISLYFMIFLPFISFAD